VTDNEKAILARIRADMARELLLADDTAWLIARLESMSGDCLLMYEEHGKMLAEVKRQAERVRRLTEALTPSAETKAAFLGEFRFPMDGFDSVAVPWTTVKEIMKAIAARAALEDGR
jgi:hypothetical protein